jgi:hypothetical protein
MRFKPRSLPSSFDCHLSSPEDQQRRSDIETSILGSVETTATQFADVLGSTRWFVFCVCTPRKAGRMRSCFVADTKLPSGKTVSLPIQTILLEDYVEELALFAVGPWNVASFFAHCFL